MNFKLTLTKTMKTKSILMSIRGDSAALGVCANSSRACSASATACDSAAARYA